MTVLERDAAAEAEELAEIESDWALWLGAIAPAYCGYPMGPHHVEFWDWLWAIEPGARPDAFIGAWARGGAKSTSAELGAVALGARALRRYGLYVCDTQDRADDHVANIASVLESDQVAEFYPDLARRRLGKHGNSRGWRRNRIWTASGFVVDALGLDTAARGIKLEDQRPDFMVLDDLDGLHDTPTATTKKIRTLTQSVIPAGAEDLAVLGIQNLIIPDGIFARLCDGRADFLRRRRVSGPVPALAGMRTAVGDDGIERIVAGDPTWPGQSLERCIEIAEDTGLLAFRRECQHEVGDAPGSLWSRDQLEAGRVQGDRVPDLDLVVVSVDPSGGKGKGHDEQGIIATGRGADGHGYVLEDHTCSLSSMGWGKAAVRCAVDLQADRIIVEDNYGGEMAANTIRVAADALVAEGLVGAARFGGDSSAVVQRSASGNSKAGRARPVAALCGEKEKPETWPAARLHLVGALPELESELTGWEPDVGGKSPNRLDAMTHGVTELGVVPKAKGRRRSIVTPEAA